MAIFNHQQSHTMHSQSHLMCFSLLKSSRQCTQFIYIFKTFRIFLNLSFIWYYIMESFSFYAAFIFSQVTEVALVLLSRDFNPEKYETLCKIFLQQYQQTGSPTSILEGYLSVVTRGTCVNDENGKFLSADYDKRQAFARVCLKGMLTFLNYDLGLKNENSIYHGF